MQQVKQWLVLNNGQVNSHAVKQHHQYSITAVSGALGKDVQTVSASVKQITVSLAGHVM